MVRLSSRSLLVLLVLLVLCLLIPPAASVMAQETCDTVGYYAPWFGSDTQGKGTVAKPWETRAYAEKAVVRQAERSSGDACVYELGRTRTGKRYIKGTWYFHYSK